MIISVSGKINSGKDTIGKILQILLNNPHLNNEGVLSFLKKDINFDSPYYKNWQIKKFADKLKDIVCLLLNVDRETLEDREFKEKELGEEWWYYKGEVGIYPYNTPYEANKKLPLIKPTPRLLLQLIGTECGRQILHPNIWVNALMSDYKTEVIPNENYGSNRNKPKNWVITKEEEQEYLLDNSHWVYKDEVNVISPNWVITDMRFPNEIKAVKDRDGITIRVNRFNTCNCGNFTDWKYDTIKDGSNRYCGVCGTKQTIKDEHESETSLDSAIFDYTIENDSDLISLVKKVRIILKKEQLI